MLINFRKRGRGREREGNINVRNINQLPPVRALTGDQTHNFGMCPDQELNSQPFGVRDNTPTEPPSQGIKIIF